MVVLAFSCEDFLNMNIESRNKTEGPKQPNDQNKNNGHIKKILYPSLHRNKSVDGPKDKTYNNKNNDYSY